MYTYIHAYIRTYMHTCIHTYIHVCMHAYIIHTYIRTCDRPMAVLLRLFSNLPTRKTTTMLLKHRILPVLLFLSNAIRQRSRVCITPHFSTFKTILVLQLAFLNFSF